MFWIVFWAIICIVFLIFNFKRILLSFKRRAIDRKIRKMNQGLDAVRAIAPYNRAALLKIATKSKFTDVRKEAASKAMGSLGRDALVSFALSDDDILAKCAIDELRNDDIFILRNILPRIQKRSVKRYACQKLGHDWDGCVCRCCGLTRHRWEYSTYEHVEACPGRGKGQHLDPCYGHDCDPSCPSLERIETTHRICTLCGKEEWE